MGARLAQAVGDQYVPIAIGAYQIHTNWYWLKEMPEHPEPCDEQDCVTKRLHDLGRPFLLVDFQDPGQALFPRGESFQYDYQLEFVSGIPREQFGGMLFLDDSPGNEYPF